MGGVSVFCMAILNRLHITHLSRWSWRKNTLMPAPNGCGGVRGSVDISARLDAGADRVVIGSLSVTDSAQFIDWLKQFGAARLVAALDILFDDAGVPWPRIHGWTSRGERNLWQLLDELTSGGVSDLDDFKQLKVTSATGVITGKALLDGRFTVEQALAALQ
jgi:phosphoribosylformimino-5-aminoimidazole carboxamide ribotide isomerase